LNGLRCVVLGKQRQSGGGGAARAGLVQLRLDAARSTHSPKRACGLNSSMRLCVFHVPCTPQRSGGVGETRGDTREKGERKTREKRLKDSRDRSPVTGCAGCGASTCGDLRPQLWRSQSTCLPRLFLFSRCHRSRSFFCSRRQQNYHTLDFTLRRLYPLLSVLIPVQLLLEHA
jgi:hypothetical protein